MSSTIRLFICGSALRGQPDHGVLAGATFLREVHTAPRYRIHSVNDAHPAVYPVKREGVSVAGELYELTATQHENLLAQEPPGLYEDDVILEDGSTARALCCFRAPLLKNVVMSTSLPTVAGPPTGRGRTNISAVAKREISKPRRGFVAGEELFAAFFKPSAMPKTPSRQKVPRWCVLMLLCLQACSFGPASATSCSVRIGPGHAAMLSATLTNNTSKAIRHVGVWVNAEGMNGAGRSEVEYEFEVPLAPHQTRRDLTGKEYDDSDEARLSCESEPVQSKACRDLKAKNYKVTGPPGLPIISPPPFSEDAHLGPIEECSARLVLYADGTGWSVSPM